MPKPSAPALPSNGHQNGAMVDTSATRGDTSDPSLRAKTRRLEAQLLKFYEIHAPDKSGVAREVALHYVGDEDALNETLRQKYGHCLTSSPANGGIREKQPAEIIELKVPSHLRSPLREKQEPLDPVEAAGEKAEDGHAGWTGALLCLGCEVLKPVVEFSDEQRSKPSDWLCLRCEERASQPSGVEAHMHPGTAPGVLHEEHHEEDHAPNQADLMSRYGSWSAVGKATEAAAAAVAQVRTTVEAGDTVRADPLETVPPFTRTVEKDANLGIPSPARSAKAEPAGSPHRPAVQLPSKPLVLDSRRLRKSEVERLGVQSGGHVFAETKPVAATNPRVNGGVSLVEGVQMKESNLLALRKGARRPLLYAVDLNLLYVNPPVVAGFESLVYADERALPDETLIETQDLLVAIDDYDVAQSNTEVIKYLLTSTRRNSNVNLKLISAKRHKVYSCTVQRSKCVSNDVDWYYEVKDHTVLVANAEIVDVLEDIRLKVLNNKGRLADLLTLDDTEPGRSSLGFRIAWRESSPGSTERRQVYDSLEVLYVMPGGCADGFVQVGDFILEIEGRPVYQCEEDEIISLFRGEETVGSLCNLVIDRRGARLLVQISRTINSQSSDAGALMGLCEHLEDLTRGVEVMGVRDAVTQMRQHVIIMEKRRSQREGLVAKRLHKIQSEIVACIAAAESYLQPPGGLMEILPAQPVNIDQMVSVLDESGEKLQEVLGFVETVQKFSWESGDRLHIGDLVQMLEVLKECKYVSVEQAAHALSHYGTSLSIVIGQSSETIARGSEAYAAERAARLQAEKIALEYSSKLEMLQQQANQYQEQLREPKHWDEARVLREANRRLAQDLASARALAQRSGSVQNSVPTKLDEELKSPQGQNKTGNVELSLLRQELHDAQQDLDRCMRELKACQDENARLCEENLSLQAATNDAATALSDLQTQHIRERQRSLDRGKEIAKLTEEISGLRAANQALMSHVLFSAPKNDASEAVREQDSKSAAHMLRPKQETRHPRQSEQRHEGLSLTDNPLKALSVKDWDVQLPARMPWHERERALIGNHQNKDRLQAARLARPGVEGGGLVAADKEGDLRFAPHTLQLEEEVRLLWQLPATGTYTGGPAGMEPLMSAGSQAGSPRGTKLRREQRQV